MIDSSILKEFGGNLKPVFQRGKGSDVDKEVVVKAEFDLLPIQSVVRNTEQSRKSFSTNEIGELAESIKKQGVLQPIIVRPIGDNKYELIAGERRLRASELAELNKIPALVKEYDDKEAFFIALIENLQREDLNSIEEATAYKKLAKNYNLSHEQIGAEVGKSRVAITNILRLLNLENEIQVMLKKNIISMGHARTLISLKRESQLKIANDIIEKSLTVRDAEAMVAKFERLEPKKQVLSNEVDSKINEFVKRLTNSLPSKVKINVNSKWKGRATIYFESEQELAWLVDRIGKA